MGAVDVEWRLRVSGAVGAPLALSLAELQSMPQDTLVTPFHCEEGWTLPPGVWRGVGLRRLLGQAQPAAEARYLIAGAGDYTVRLDLADSQLDQALVALEREGRPITAAEGGPARLVVPGGSCFLSVKRLDGLEATSEAAPTSGEERALSRAAAGPFRDAVAAARGGPCDDERLQEIWDALEARLPGDGARGTPAAAAEMVVHLLQGRLGPRLPQGRLYRERLHPLAQRLQSLLGERDPGDRRAVWHAFVADCAAVYCDRRVPYRYRLLAQQWAQMGAGAAFQEAGQVLVPPTLDGTPPAPFWLEM